MKIRCLVSCLLFFPILPLGAQEAASPAADTRERQIRIQVEWIEVDAETATELLRRPESKSGANYAPVSSNATPLRTKLQELIDDGDAALIESTMVVARSGQRAKVESIHELIYPTVFIPAEMSHPADGKTVVVAPQPDKFETRNLGVTLEVDPVLGQDNRTIDLNLAPEIVYLTGYETWATHEGQDTEMEIRTPNIFTVKTTTQITARDGECVLMSVNTPRNLKTGMTDPERRIFTIVRADLEVVGLEE